MRKNKKVFKKATIGASLLMSAVLLCGNTVKAHAQADLTPEESQKLTEFLATQPTNGARTSLGLTNNVSHSTYKFNRNNFTSVFESRATKTKLDKDYDFILDDGNHAGETVHIKNWQDLEVFDLSTAEPYGAAYGMGKYLFAKQVTFVTDDGTEFIEHNVALPVDFDGAERYDKTAYPNRYVFDYPIEEEDSRFTHDIMGVEDMAVSGGTGYWQITAIVNEEIPYDTIAEIDENLKQGEIVEVTQGEIGNKIGTFNLTVGDDLGSRYLDYDADVIYNDLKDLFSTSSIQKDAFFVRDWGMATFVEGGAVDAKDRLLHVGVDYTQYVTEDGTTLKNKEYGVHEKETFAGYEYITTRTEANGDTVHVYKKVVTPTTTPEPETPVNPTNPGNSGNVNGGNDEDTTPANPTEGETPVSPTPTPNPTPKPDVPVVEDNHGNNTGGNTETPSVPNPTPEPSVPTDETPNQPGNPTNPVNETPVNPTPVQPVEPTKPNEEKPVVPNNPTDNTVTPPVVEEKPVIEEKPVDNTVSNKVEDNTVVNNSTATIKKDDRVIETGVRTNLFTNFAMTVISGFGLLTLALKKKESK